MIEQVPEIDERHEETRFTHGPKLNRKIRR
jgi:hypothetical protein